jgi:hypothetical protein
MEFILPPYSLSIQQACGRYWHWGSLASGVFQDEKGRTLVAYFGRQAETNAKVMTYLWLCLGWTDKLPVLLIVEWICTLHSRTQDTLDNGTITSMLGQGAEGRPKGLFKWH